MTQREKSRRRRWFQFSLRTLFVLMTIVAVWLGMVMHKARKLRGSIEAITMAGGQVYFHHQLEDTEAPAPGLAALRRLVGDEPFIAPFEVILVGPEVTDEFVAEHLRSMASIEHLTIESPQVTDAALAHIESMPDLHFLTLDSPRLTDGALAHIAHRDELYQLVLKCPLLTDGALPRIATLPKLGFLELNCPRVTASGIRQLEPLKHLEGVRSYRDLNNWDVVRSLRYPANVDLADVPLMDVFDYLTDFYNDVPFHTDDLPEAKGMTRVTVTPHSKSLGAVLDAILQPNDLGYYFDRGTIRITSREEDGQRREGEAAFRAALPSLQRVEVDW